MASTRKPMTLTQKVLAHHARGLTRPWVQAGDVLQIQVDWTIASELAWNGMDKTYQALGRPRIHDKERFFLAVDHTVDPVTLATDKRAQKLTHFVLAPHFDTLRQIPSRQRFCHGDGVPYACHQRPQDQQRD